MADKDPNDTHTNTSRRGLFRALGRGVQGAIVQEYGHLVNTRRPLGAVVETLFLRLCNQCGNCVSACTQQVLVMTDTGPVMDLTLDYCTLCTDCITACPSNALNRLAQLDTGWRPKISNSCNARTMGNCEECAEDCPIGAITIEPDALPMISNACHGCGACVSSCYISALVMIPAEVYQRTL